MEEEDAKLHTFLHLLSERSAATLTSSSKSTTAPSNTVQSGNVQDTSQISSSSFTTVPPPLSRRILYRQGVGFIDENVATITSIAADKFLATIVAQSIACRDHRIEGDEVRKNERKQQREYRKRRRKEFKERQKSKQAEEKASTDAKVKLITAHHALKAATGKGSLGDKVAKRNKKESITSLQQAVASAHSDLAKVEREKGKQNGNASTGVHQHDDDDEISMEEDDLLLNESSSSEDDDEDEEDEERSYVLQLRDVVRPLEGWGIQLTGKAGVVGPYSLANGVASRKSEQARKDDYGDASNAQGLQDGEGAMGSSADASPSKPSEDGDKKGDVSQTKQSGATAQTNKS